MFYFASYLFYGANEGTPFVGYDTIPLKEGEEPSYMAE